jgi:protocatechuate 3,4-dioxygenase alpha subunit
MDATTSQTVGPFFRIGLQGLYSGSTVTRGPAIAIGGRVLDGRGQPVPDALLELWQADASGAYAHPESPQRPDPSFHGFCRIPTDPDGAFRFTTVKPGRVRGPGGAQQAPHIVVLIFMRGLLKHLMSRIYFPDETAANESDPVLKLVPAERRGTLLARPAGDALEWNVVLQGDGETVFFDY